MPRTQHLTITLLDDQGVLNARNISELQKLRDDFSLRGLVRYSIPVVCGTENVPIDLFIWDWKRDYPPSDPQFDWLEASRGCKVATVVRDKFQKLFAIAQENHASYSGLVKYAMALDPVAIAPTSQPIAEASVQTQVLSLQSTTEGTEKVVPDQKQAILNSEVKTGLTSIEPSSERALVADTEVIEQLPSMDTKPEKFVSQGQKLYQQKQYQQALVSFNLALTIYKNRQDHENTVATLLHVARCYNELKQFQKALETNQQALQLAEQAIGKESTAVVASLYDLVGLHHLNPEGDAAQAIPLLERALVINEKIYGSEHASVADNLRYLGVLLHARGDHRRAIPLLKRAIAIQEKVGGAAHNQMPETITVLAASHIYLGDSPQAIPLLERAIAIREPEDVLKRNLNILAGLYLTLGDFAQARSLFEQALAISDKIHGLEHPDTAQMLFNLSTANQALGDFAKAQLNLERALRIREKVFGPEHELVAQTLEKLAIVMFTPDANTQAKVFYERALSIRENLNGSEHAKVVTSLNNLAGLYRRLGNYGAAKTLYERAIAIQEKVYGTEHINVVPSLSGLASLYITTDDHAQAKPIIERSLTIIDKFRSSERDDAWEKLFKHFEPIDSTLILGNLAELYIHLGDYAQAQLLIEPLLPNLEKIFGPNSIFVTIALSKLADVHIALGEYAQAKPIIERSLAIQEKSLGREDAAISRNLIQLASVYAAGGEYAKAIPLVERSLKLLEKTYGAEHAMVASNLSDLAWLYGKLDDYESAKPLFERALRIAVTSHQPQLLWSVQYKISLFFSGIKQPEAAILFGKQAVNNLQAQRGNLAALEKGLQKSFLSSVSKYYRDLADLLIEQGRLPEAQQVLTMLKEEEYHDFIHRDSEDDSRATLASFTPAEAAWQEEYQNIADRLVMLGDEMRLLETKKSEGLTKTESARIQELAQMREVAFQSFQRSFGKLAITFDKANSMYAHEQKKLKLENDLTNLVQELGKGVVLLQTVTMDDSIWLLLTTSESRKVHKVKVSKKELNQHINTFRETLRMTEFDPRPAGQMLYKLLLEPIRTDLQLAKTQVLMLSLDGALRYIPFAALHDGQNYLIEHYALSFLNEAVQDNLKVQPKTTWKVAGLGTSEQYPGFSPLPAVPEELKGIVRKNATDSGGILEGIIRLNGEFDQEQLRSVMHQEYPVLHIASHYQFKPGSEKDSFLLLGDGSRLDLSQIRQGNYSFKGVDLFTLSACNTAIGGTGEGREVEGLAVLAQKKGAKGVLATLWSVADKSTSVLMQTMYRLHQTQQLSKANALQQAQLTLLRGTVAGDTTPQLTRAESTGPVRMKTYHANKQRPYAHPYFWAPFILMGNWL